MVEYQLLNTTDIVTTLEEEAIINFLMSNLDAYSDSRDNVSRAVEYALSKFPHQGGFIILAKKDRDIVGATVINRTNLEGYFAESILVFMATDEACRGDGIGKELLRQTILFTKGDVMVRLKPETKNTDLFEKQGFKSDFQGFLLKRG